MKPVFQTETTPGKGNCMSACLASLLELPIADVPNFRLEDDPWQAVQDWLGERGLYAVRVRASPEWIFPTPEVWCILCGPSATVPDGKHAVVGKWRGDETVAVHDPRPDGKMLGGPVEWVIFLASLVHVLPGEGGVKRFYSDLIQQAVA